MDITKDSSARLPFQSSDQKKRHSIEWSTSNGVMLETPTGAKGITADPRGSPGDIKKANHGELRRNPGHATDLSGSPRNSEILGRAQEYRWGDRAGQSKPLLKSLGGPIPKQSCVRHVRAVCAMCALPKVLKTIGFSGGVIRCTEKGSRLVVNSWEQREKRCIYQVA